jgi:hypothetical protein
MEGLYPARRPALSNSNKSGIFWVKENMTLPVSFKIFVGTVIWILRFYMLVQFSVTVKYISTSIPVLIAVNFYTTMKIIWYH